MSYALITGASKGIGKSMALQLAAKKTNLLLVARSEDALKALAEEVKNTYGVEAAYFALDLAQADAADQVLEWVKTKGYSIHMLINNAGYGVWGEFSNASLDDLLKMMQLNMQTLVKMTYLFLPILKKEKKSYILNIASTAAYQAVPTLSTYAASKAFVLAFSRGLFHELKGSNVSMTVVSPGATETYFATRAGISEKVTEKNAKFFMQPDEVAKIALDAMFKQKDEVITGFVNAASAFATRILPKGMIESIAAGIYKH